MRARSYRELFGSYGGGAFNLFVCVGADAAKLAHWKIGGLKWEVPLEWKDHTHQIGCIVTNLQALETVLRYFLLRLHNQEAQFPKAGDPDASVTYLTKYAFLGQLVDEYNRVLGEAEKQFEVDTTVIDIRDAIAHGRLLTSKELPYRLWRFGRPKNGRVRVEFSEELTLEWLQSKSNMIYGEKQKVLDCFNARGYKGLQ